MKVFNLFLELAFHTKIKIMAAKSGVSMQEFIIQAIQEKIEREGKK